MFILNLIAFCGVVFLYYTQLELGEIHKEMKRANDLKEKE